MTRSRRTERRQPIYYLLTLGCPKNTVDSEGMAMLLQQDGYRATADPAEADLLVVNTCGFLEAAKEESIAALQALAQDKRQQQRLVAAGCLVVAAVIEFARVRTTIVPRKAPSGLITSGIFRYSRNPIYLADLLILAGLALLWGSVIGLLLVPVLGWILHVRFIRGEEERLTEAFGEEYLSYCAATRRWI